MDSTIYQAITITADKTPGVIYYATMSEALYISCDYGNIGSWQFVNGGISLYINSGVTEGYIYNAIVSHSENYGNSFTLHNYNGFFGNMIDSEIDNQSNVGYSIVNKYGVNDSLYILMTYDNYENLFIKHEFNLFASSFVRLSRGNQIGELYLLHYQSNKLLFSNSFGDNWIEVNKLNYQININQDIVGGRDEGELFLLYTFVNMMGQNAHTYILYSNDYGITYEVFHPFSKGQEPLLANFSAKVENSSIGDFISVDSVYYPTGEIPLTVQFYNYSIGDINSYEWDFENDGVIDSYEKNPVYTYQDTGWYSVSLTVYDGMDTNSFLREDYIITYKITGVADNLPNEIVDFRCYPNPFTDKITLDFGDKKIKEPTTILIYNAYGEIVNTIYSNNNLSVTWDGKSSSGKKLNPGIYYCKIDTKNTSAKKILLTY
jgi:PKD repeat protein